MRFIKNSEWFCKLDIDSKGSIAPTMSNIVEILKNDKYLQNIYYNTMNGSYEILGEVPWKRNKGQWNAADNACLILYLEKEYGIYAPIKCKDAIYAYLSTEKYIHPLRDYLVHLQWDGVERVDRLLIDYMGADDNEYVRAVTRKTLIAAVTRVFSKGIKFDNVLVLCGPQGIGKSTFFSKLGDIWYSDSLTVNDMKDKTAAEKLQGVWIMEIGELAGLRKVDVEIVKSFLSRTDDRYRHTYGQYVESHPRTCIIVGSTNSTEGFLRDITGNRRFWPVNVTGKAIKNIWNMKKEDINQIWAEAVNAYMNGEKIYLTEEINRKTKIYQAEFMETDPRQGIIEEYLIGKKRTCIVEIWCECLNKAREDIRKPDSREIEGILVKMGGWKVYDKNKTGKTRIKGYGIQKTYERI